MRAINNSDLGTEMNGNKANFEEGDGDPQIDPDKLVGVAKNQSWS